MTIIVGQPFHESRATGWIAEEFHHSIEQLSIPTTLAAFQSRNEWEVTHPCACIFRAHPGERSGLRLQADRLDPVIGSDEKESQCPCIAATVQMSNSGLSHVPIGMKAGASQQSQRIGVCCELLQLRRLERLPLGQIPVVAIIPYVLINAGKLDRRSV